MVLQHILLVGCILLIKVTVIIISVFQSDGQFCISFGSGQLGGPYDVAVTGNNQLLVADHSHKCIVTFTLDGHYVGRFDTQGSHSCQINSP